MDHDLFSRDFDSRPPKGDNLFTWTVLILLLIGFAFACWLGSYYIFGHPENARSYKILKKLHKIDVPRRFELTAAPPGEFLTPQKLFDRYFAFTPLQIKNENSELMRNYINNYQLTKKLVPYVIGRFNILNSIELKNSDLFSSGVVALAQSVDSQNVLIEHVYTANSKNVPLLRKMLMPGLDIKLEKNLDLAAVIHFERLKDGRLQFTVVPLLYGSYALKQGAGGFSLEPPTTLNLDGGVPIVRGPLLQEALKTYAIKAAPKSGLLQNSAGAANGPAQPPSSAELVRVEATPTPVSEPQPTPVAVADNSPAPAPSPTPVSVPETTPEPLVTQATPTPRPEAPAHTPHPTPAIAVATPTPASSPASPQAVPLQPFLEANPTPTITAPTATWRTYAPGQMPRGRLIEPVDVNQMVDRGLSGERVYLRGNFVVTASKGNRVVLRTRNSLGIENLIKGGSGSIRIIVDYPAGSIPPEERDTFSRDEMRPFQVTDVRRGSDGQINIYAREITAQ